MLFRLCSSWLTALPLTGDPCHRGAPIQCPSITSNARKFPICWNSGVKAMSYSGPVIILKQFRPTRVVIRRRCEGTDAIALRFLNNLGSADYQLLRYRDAVKAYLQAREFATSQFDQETLAAIYSNLSSLYDQMGESDAATESRGTRFRTPGRRHRKVPITSVNPVRVDSNAPEALGSCDRRAAPGNRRGAAINWMSKPKLRPGTSLAMRCSSAASCQRRSGPCWNHSGCAACGMTSALHFPMNRSGNSDCSKRPYRGSRLL